MLRRLFSTELKGRLSFKRGIEMHGQTLNTVAEMLAKDKV